MFKAFSFLVGPEKAPILRGLTIAYFLLLCALLVALEWWGERSWIIGIALYAPPQIFLAPLLILTPWGMRKGSRWLVLHVLCVLIVAFAYPNFQLGFRSEPKPSDIVLITHNIGQGNRDQFHAFVASQKPDFIVMQDSQNRKFERTFPDYEIAVRNEFALASKHLIQKVELVESVKSGNRAVAARFEVYVRGQAMAIYNIHLPTPRARLNRVLSARIVPDLFLDDSPKTSTQSYRVWMDERIALARRLADVLSAEKLPVLAAGDFNAPDHGYIYRMFASEFVDSHRAAGRGWGMTFPGHVRNPVSFFGPWLRLDYVFAGKGWTVRSCDVDPGRISQHCAVAVRLDRE